MIGVPARVGEVVQIEGVASFWAELYRSREPTPPQLGALLRLNGGGSDVFAVVSDITHESLDPGRKAIARGEGLDSEEEIDRQHPQIPLLFRTLLRGHVVGFRSAGAIRQHLPDAPARVHAFVYECDGADAAPFLQAFDYLRLLLGIGPLADEVTAACLRWLARQAGEGSRDFLVRAGKELALVLANDPNRLSAILRRVRP